MKCRYTLTASAELEESVSYLLTHAPHVAGRFADSIDDAVGALLEHPYTAQQTALAGVYENMCAPSATRSSMQWMPDQTNW